MVEDAAATRIQLSAANDRIADLEGQVRSNEERTTQLERELEDARVSRAADLAQFSKKIRA